MHARQSAVKDALPVLLAAAAAFVVCGNAFGAERHVDATFFFTPGCRMCKETKEAVRAAERRFGTRLTVEWVDLSDPDAGTGSAKRLFGMLDEHGIEETPSLAFFVGGTCLAGGERIIADVSVTIEAALSRSETASVPVFVDRLGFWAVSAAALADGVNPCAFATIVLLVSLMATAGRTRGQILLIGGAFSLAVFLTYFVIGLVFFGALSELRGFYVVSDLIYYVAFGACAVCGVVSLYDAALAARGRDAGDMVLKLPESLRERIQRLLKGAARSRALVAASFGAGVLVSVFESACTGQVYFPVIAGLVRAPGSTARGVGLLLWYNALFVLPLLVILGLSVLGVESAALARAGRRHWGIAKLLLACVFIAMAAWMWPGLVWPPGVR